MTGQAPAQATGPAPAQATSPVLAQTQDADLAALRSQVGESRVELAGLKAKWDGLKTQLDNMLRSNPARPGVQQQWADVGVQIATVEGKIATLDAAGANRASRRYDRDRGGADLGRSAVRDSTDGGKAGSGRFGRQLAS